MENYQLVSLVISEMSFADWQPINFRILLPKIHKLEMMHLPVVIYYH